LAAAFKAHRDRFRLAIVLRVDAHHMYKQEALALLADLANEVLVGRKLEVLRFYHDRGWP
jgi:hypothetical protein